MASELQRVAGELLGCIDRIPNMSTHLSDMARKCRESAEVLWSLGSSNPHATTAAEQLERAATACDRASEVAGRVPPIARGWAEQMVSGGRDASSSGNQGPVPRSVLPKSDEIDRVLSRLPKRNDANSDPTTGVFIDENGNESRFSSGRGDELERKALELCRENNWPLYDRTSHVELKFATYMRLNGIMRATLYLNKEPCKIPGNNCRKLLPEFLPHGAKLVIYGPGGYRGSFEGE